MNSIHPLCALSPPLFAGGRLSLMVVPWWWSSRLESGDRDFGSLTKSLGGVNAVLVLHRDLNQALKHHLWHLRSPSEVSSEKLATLTAPIA